MLSPDTCRLCGWGRAARITCPQHKLGWFIQTEEAVGSGIIESFHGPREGKMPPRLPLQGTPMAYQTPRLSPLEKKHLTLPQFTQQRRPPPHCLSSRNKTGRCSCFLLNTNNSLQAPLAYLRDALLCPALPGPTRAPRQQDSLWPSRRAPRSLAFPRGLCKPCCPAYLPLLPLASSGHAHAPHRHSPSWAMQPLKQQRACVRACVKSCLLTPPAVCEKISSQLLRH